MGMEFCIWGCGKRGKNIYRFMRGKDVCAFIDSNPEFQGSAYQNVPIISFETYLKQYRECIVIVTPYVGAEEIKQCLRLYYNSERLVWNDGRKKRIGLGAGFRRAI